MFRLTCATRDYAWGSRTLLPRFLGQHADGLPHAELWVGAHPGDPSQVSDGRTLDLLIAAEPDRMLGPRVATRFDGRLPFLMKALAAAEPLSLQVHPSSERARLGFAAENAAGIPIGAPDRSYQDEFHKPELLYAITRFEGMAGFRDVEKSAEILRMLDLDWSRRVADELTSGSPAEALHGVVGELLAMDAAAVADLLTDIGKAARAAEDEAHRRRGAGGRRWRERTCVEREATRVFAQTAALTEHYPDDPGVLVTLLLNHVVLSPGEAMYLDAGVVHAYTSGFGVEVMASSDNVVRAGLTPKHVDVPELLEIATFTPIPPPLCTPVRTARAARVAPPVSEFVLDVVRAPTPDLPADGPRVLLCLDGEVEAVTRTEQSPLGRGDALFVEHAAGPLAINGEGTVAVASVPA